FRIEVDGDEIVPNPVATVPLGQLYALF
ncbi:MAG: hypothetical protein JWN06_3787, partial [Propionibacteriaceae bacterium]|nr:hypothetical protein [Propionibacteriaceae bacterium]